jgi:RecB family endonuclease NucS
MQYTEKEIENKIAEDISIIDQNLEVIGTQVSLGSIGIIDILAFDIINEEYVVIELKSEIVTEKAIAQLLRYLCGMQDYMKDMDKHVYKFRGMVVAPSIEDNAKTLVRYLEDKISYYELDIELTSQECGYTRTKECESYKSGLKNFKKIIKEFNPSQFEVQLQLQEGD